MSSGAHTNEAKPYAWRCQKRLELHRSGERSARVELAQLRYGWPLPRSGSARLRWSVFSGSGSAPLTLPFFSQSWPALRTLAVSPIWLSSATLSVFSRYSSALLTLAHFSQIRPSSAYAAIFPDTAQLRLRSLRSAKNAVRLCAQLPPFSAFGGAADGNRAGSGINDKKWSELLGSPLRLANGGLWFRGSAPAKIDDKGRLQSPTDFVASSRSGTDGPLRPRPRRQGDPLPRCRLEEIEGG